MSTTTNSEAPSQVSFKLTALPAGAAFLPINGCIDRPPMNGRRDTTRSDPRENYQLALIDADRLEEFSRVSWQTSLYGGYGVKAPVFRQIYFPPEGDRKATTLPLYLASVVLGIHKQLDDSVVYLSGDRLDCRRANLVPLAAWKAANGNRRPPKAVENGSTFSHLPEFLEAFKERRRNAAELAKLSYGGHEPALSPEQVKTLLNELLESAKSGLLDQWKPSWSALNRTVCGDLFGKAISLTSLQKIARGEQQVIPGFPYHELQAHLPGSRKHSKRAELLAQLSVRV